MTDLKKNNNRLIGALVFASLIAISGLGHSVFTGSRLSKRTQRIQDLENARTRLEAEVKSNDASLKESLEKYEGLIRTQDSMISILREGFSKSRVVSGELKSQLDSLGVIQDSIWEDILE